MESLKRLPENLKDRPAAIQQARRGGRRVIGYIPGGFFPEELAIAAGAVPVGLACGCDPSMLELSGEYICRWIDPYCRTQIGYGVSGKDPWYCSLDLLAVPITDNHVRAIADVLACHTTIELFPFGVPHMKEPSTLQYYLHGISRLKEVIERRTGNLISDSKLREAIALCNRERQLLRKINLRRRERPASISSRDFIMLQHGSHFLDKQSMIELLEQVDAESQAAAGNDPAGPRLLLTGSTLARGDSLVTELIEKSGGVVLAEVFDEGLKWFMEDISVDDDPLEALAEGYFMKRICPAWFRPGGERRDFLIDLAKDLDVDGVIWYHLMFRESFKVESYTFPELLNKKAGLPMLVVESDYESTGAGNMGIRIETFLDQLRR